MPPVFVLILGAIGLTLVVTKSRLLSPARRLLSEHSQLDVALLGELLSCSLCLGTWVGFGVGLLLGYGPVGILVYGGVVSLGSWFFWGVCCTLELLGERLRR